MTEFVRQTEALVEQAVLGKQVDNFMDSDIGKYLDNLMETEYLEAVDTLTSVICTDTEAVRTAQNRIWRAKTLRNWLETAIISGLKAQVVLEDREDD
jgi:hypothetical protein